MMTRLLPSDEWPRLAGTEAETAWPTLNPQTDTVVVVEQDGQIVGCHILMYVLHAECLWIHPDHRGKASVGRRLWAAVQRFARASGKRNLWTAAIDARVCRLLAHVGATVVPGTHYLVPIGEPPCQP